MTWNAVNMVVDDKPAGSLGFAHTNISMVYKEWSQNKKLPLEQQFVGGKCLVDVRGQRSEGLAGWRP